MSSEAEGASTMLALRRWSDEVLKAVAEPLVEIEPTKPFPFLKIIRLVAVVGVVLKDAAVPELKTENTAESVVEVVPTSKLPELSSRTLFGRCLSASLDR
ncbi:MAG: hypothetical protein CM15mV86_150 [uncultured marine virus]|nr:MAG: hypothetical protein CM15mV86_150 [uncultured marine virus]